MVNAITARSIQKEIPIIVATISNSTPKLHPLQTAGIRVAINAVVARFVENKIRIKLQQFPIDVFSTPASP